MLDSCEDDHEDDQRAPVGTGSSGGGGGGGGVPGVGGANSSGRGGGSAGADGKKTGSTSNIVADCVKQAIIDHYGLDALTALSGIAAIPIRKDLVPPYRVIGTDTTNLLSLLGHFLRIDAPRLMVGTRASANALRIIGRANPYLFAALAVIDLTVIGKDATDCYKNQTAGSNAGHE